MGSGRPSAIDLRTEFDKSHVREYLGEDETLLGEHMLYIRG